MKTSFTLVVLVLSIGIVASQIVVNSNEIDAIPVEPLPMNTCCPWDNSLSLDLKTGNINGLLEGATLLSTPTVEPNNKICGKQADLRINFNKLGSCILPMTKKGCLDFPACGRRILRVDLYFDRIRSNRKGHVINIGDSRTNNGYGGDSSSQTNDAEIHGPYPHFLIYQNDKCVNTRGYQRVLKNVLNAYHVTIYVSNQHVRITNDKGLDKKFCHKCLFALNGQSDYTGPVNEDIYVSLNKVVSGRWRNGQGLCRVNLKWQCPC